MDGWDRIGTGLLTDHVARPSWDKDHEIPGRNQEDTGREYSHTDGARLLFGEAFPSVGEKRIRIGFRIMLFGLLYALSFSSFFRLECKAFSGGGD